MPGPGQRSKYPRGLLWRMKKNRKSKGKRRTPPPSQDVGSPEGPRGGGTGSGIIDPPWGGAKGGRVGKSSGGSVRDRLSSGGPVAKAN